MFLFRFIFLCSSILDKNMSFKRMWVSFNLHAFEWLKRECVCVCARESNEYAWCLAHKKCNKIAATQREKLVKPTKQHWYQSFIFGTSVLFHHQCDMCVCVCVSSQTCRTHQKPNELRFIVDSGKFYCRVQISTQPILTFYCFSVSSFVIYATS